jgi:glycogen debranching enzyme
MAKKKKSVHLPEDFVLLPGETLVVDKTIHHPPRLFDKVPSSIEQMQRLTRSRTARMIGRNGPSVAALSFERVSPKNIALQSLAFFNKNLVTESIPDHLRLYEVVFGRDSLRVAIDLMSSYPELARSTVLRLAELQGIEFHREREEEPGKILHEARSPETDERAQKITRELGWDWPYYGSVDATPEFIRTLTAYCRVSEENYNFLSYPYVDRNGQRRSIAYALDMALEWIIRKLDSNEESLLEYQSVIPRGIENQVWKDSADAYHHSDGTIANHKKGIASIEVQVTTFDALLDAAELYERMYGDIEQAKLYRRKAAKLKKSIFAHFWTDEKGGYFVLGTDRDDSGALRQMKVRTSNMGHMLNSRILEGTDHDLIAKRNSLIRQLLSPQMLNISGIRTLASDEVRFRPGAYHNGTVWLWDTHHIAKGFRRHGYDDIANELDRRMLHVIETTKIFPEYVRGDTWILPRINEHTIIVWDKAMNREMCVEQPPQEVQAWTVAAILAIKKRVDRNQKSFSKPIEVFGENLMKTLRIPDTIFGIRL